MKHFEPAGSRNYVAEEYEALKYGAFVHLNMQQFVYTRDEFTQVSDPSVWNPVNLDVEQWFVRWKEAGIRYAILTTRHTSDFCLWDTKTTETNVMNSPVPVDIVSEFVKYARKYDIKPCFYYCIWGGAYNAKENAEEIMLAQLDELMTRYGGIYLMWMDMANWRPDGMSVQQIYDFIKNRQPDTLVHFNQHIQDGTTIHYFPTDVLNGEERIPPKTGHAAVRSVEGREYYLPFEYEICLQKVEEAVGKGYTQGTRWFTYSEGGEQVTPSHPAPMRELYPYIHDAYERGASNVILSTAPDYTGQVREEDIAALTQIKHLIDNRADKEVRTGSMITGFTLKTTEKVTGPVSLCVKTEKAVRIEGLGRYFSAEDTEDAQVSLADEEGKVIARVLCRADSSCDMLGFRYGSCEPVWLEEGKRYTLSCGEETWTHYVSVSTEMEEAFALCNGLPLMNLIIENRSDNREAE